jgi:hypothetical protein
LLCRAMRRCFQGMTPHPFVTPPLFTLKFLSVGACQILASTHIHILCNKLQA